MKKNTLLLGVVVLVILSSCKKDLKQDLAADMQPITSDDQMVKPQTDQKFVPNELLVRFKKSTLQSGRLNALARISGVVEEQVITASMRRNGDDEGFYLVHTKFDVTEAVQTMKENPSIEYAEPNYIYTYGAVSNDPYYMNGLLWGMNGSYGCNASTAWANGHTGAANVYVGIVDEGAMFNHEDLAGNFGNPYEIAGNRRDDDGNGYVDDTNGYDFVSNDNTTFDGTTDDHGTHVAGTIGATGGNGKGVAGVNWNIKMILAKFLGPAGGTTANAVKAIDYITYLKTHDGLNIVATNNSWGGGGFSQALQDAIERANAADILFIAAAGNGGSDGVGDNNDNVSNYPSNYPNSNIIAVAAITQSGALASFSNYGASTVDIGAPGSGIYSTLPGSGKGKTITSTYGSYSGTSMATPHVTGAAALYKSTHPSATGAEIKNAILSNATPTPSLNGKCTSNGRLNVGGF